MNRKTGAEHDNEREGAPHIGKFFRKRYTITLVMVLFVFFVMISTALLISVVMMVIGYQGVLLSGPHPALLVIMMLFVSVVVGTIIAAIFSRRPMRPFKEFIDATKEISNGNFDIKVNAKGPREILELADSMNKMAAELRGMAMLRTDFVNNFSHEFKTPIVSIRGFARLLKDGELSREEREEYIDIIISESERLAQLSTNVLALSKVESVEIISDKKEFRLDEQLRRVVLLLEHEWNSKHIDMEISLPNVTYFGNEEMMEQIWVNLLNNTIKFSNEQGKISVSLDTVNNGVEVFIEDEGMGMDDETKRFLFDKSWYKKNIPGKLRTNGGNGIGLLIVSRIVTLCGGEVSVVEREGYTTSFRVFLPLK